MAATTSGEERTRLGRLDQAGVLGPAVQLRTEGAGSEEVEGRELIMSGRGLPPRAEMGWGGRSVVREAVWGGGRAGASGACWTDREQAVYLKPRRSWYREGGPCRSALAHCCIPGLILGTRTPAAGHSLPSGDVLLEMDTQALQNKGTGWPRAVRGVRMGLSGPETRRRLSGGW